MPLTELLWGPLFASQVLPLRLHVLACDLRPRFLVKGRVGQGYRAIARNGRVLLATDRSLAELADQRAQLRIQIWHRAILSGEHPEAYGILLFIRSESGSAKTPIYRTRLVRSPAPNSALALDVGGGMVLEFKTSDGPLRE